MFVWVSPCLVNILTQYSLDCEYINNGIHDLIPHTIIGGSVLKNNKMVQLNNDTMSSLASLTLQQYNVIISFIDTAAIQCHH